MIFKRKQDKEKNRRAERVSIAILSSLVVWSLLAWAAAEALIVRAELPQADALVVLANASAYIERTRHAADLWKEGRAPRVLLTNENLRSSWSEALQRNPFFYERATDELKLAGVSPDQIEVMPSVAVNTYGEALVLYDYAAQHNLKSILLVTSAYHSRRALWVFRQVFRDTGVRIGIDPVVPGQQTPRPATWWLRPLGWTTVALEYPKLIFYWFRYRDGTGATGDYGSVGGEQTPATTTQGATKDGMTLSLTTPATAYVDQVVQIDARKSVGLSKKPQPNGTPSVTLDFGDGFNCNLLASGHAYRAAGTYTIKLSGKNNKGVEAPPVVASITVVDIPAASGLNINNVAGQNIVDMTSPQNAAYYISPQSYSKASPNAMKLQSAIKRAAGNNVDSEQEIILPAGAVFAGPIVLPTPAGNKYITIRSSGMGNLPVAGQRVNPVAHGQYMATITAPSSTTNLLPALQTPPQAPASGPHHYRIQGIHLKKDDETRHSAVLMNIGTDGSGGQDKISKLAHDFIVDRCWFDGGASDTSQTTNGLRIYANEVSVVDSYLGDFRLIGGGVDTAAISVSTGQGPYAFVNNTMVATSENFNIAGGAADFSENSAVLSNCTSTSCTLSRIGSLEVDQDIALPVQGLYNARNSTIVRSISGNSITFDPIASAPDNGGTARWEATPSFIEFRRNYLYKPLKWRPGHPSWNGINYQLKNLWETKFSRYVVLDGNVFENQWISSQLYAIVFTVRNRTGGESPAAVVREIQFSNNIVKNVANGIVISQTDDSDVQERVSQRASDISVRNNLFWNVGANWDSTCCQHMMINLLGGPNPLKRIFVIHNTQDSGLPDRNGAHITDFGESGGAIESIWFNNVHPHGLGGFRDNFTGGVAPDVAATIKRFLPPGDSSSWTKNLIVNKGSAIYPSNGIYVTGSWSAQFVNYAAGDFTLASGPGKRAATDGTDVGVNMADLKSATEGSVSGVWISASSIRPRKVSN